MAEAAIIERTETDWDKVRAWLKEQEDNKEEPAEEWEMVGDAYKQLRELSKPWRGTVKICGRSKRWRMKEKGQEVQRGTERVPRENKEGQKRNVGTMGGRREVGMGHS